MSRVFIGVGHGGKDPGAVANGLQEKDVNLVMAMAMRDELTRHGVEVGISRTIDENDPLADEIAECNTFAPDLAVELHDNAGGGKGFEAYRQESGEYAAQSLRLAKLIEARVMEHGQNSRGVKGERSPAGYVFGWLARCDCPAVLLEGAFLDNAEDVKMIGTEAKQRAFGVAYARGVLDYLGIAWRPGQTDNGNLTAIMGQSVATAEQMRTYLRAQTPTAPDYAAIYLEEGAAEGVCGDIAFAQACLETGYWRFGGDVQPDQNNFCGLGATGGGVPGHRFDTPREGIRAQVQHLKAYASADPLAGECVDPRFDFVQRGCAPYVEWLGQNENPAGKGWAVGVGYGGKVLGILGGILASEATAQAGELEELRKANGRLRSENEAMGATINAILELMAEYA